MFLLSKKGQKETFFDILDRKVLTKSKNIDILEGVSPWLLSKNRPFLCLFFNKKKPTRTFFDILDRK